MHCSLRIDIVNIRGKWGWRIFQRQEGINQSLSSPRPFKNAISPEDIFAKFMRAAEKNHIDELKEFGKYAWRILFEGSISEYIEPFTGGDILFEVPVEWADVPFELICLPDNTFLGSRMNIGTIIVQNESFSAESKINTDDNLSIVADPSQTLKAAYEEGVFLKNLAIKNIKTVHLMTTGDKVKMNELIEQSAMVHFAGRSFKNAEKPTSGWELSPGLFYNLEDMVNLSNFQQKPWLIFSNSCHAGNAGNDLSGIAGALMRAGVLQVVGPTREVNDSIALKIAEIFYTNLFKGVSAAESLRIARLQLLSDKNACADVCFYRLFGDPRFNALSKKKKAKSNDMKISIAPKHTLFIIAAVVLIIMVLIVLLFPISKDSIFFIPAR